MPVREDVGLVDAAGFVKSLKDMRHLPQTLAEGREVVVTIIESDYWREFYWPSRTGPDVVRFATFEIFVCSGGSSGGLGWSLEDLREYVRGDPVAEDAVDRVTQRKAGGDTRSVEAQADLQTNVSNRNVGRPVGTTARQALRTLRQKRPDLHKQVLDGELSAHAAMVQGGFRKKTITVPCDVEGAAKALRRKLSAADFARLGELITEEL